MLTDLPASLLRRGECDCRRRECDCHTFQIYAIRKSISKALVAFYHKYIEKQSTKEIRAILLRYDTILLVADLRRFEPKKFGGRRVRAMFQKPTIFLLVGTNIGDISIWETIMVKVATTSVNRCVWGPNGSILGVAFSKHIIQIYAYNLAGELRQHLEVSPRLRFNKEGSLLVVTTSDNRIKIITNNDGQRLLRMLETRAFDGARGHSEAVNVKPAMASGIGPIANFSASMPPMLERNDRVQAPMSLLASMESSRGADVKPRILFFFFF